MKEFLMEQEERGYYYVGDKYVCKECFFDNAIKSFIKDNATSFKCDYCGKKSREKNIAAAIDEVLGLIVNSIEYEWGDPNDEGVPYETAEGGWQGKVLNSYELFFEEIDLPTYNKQLRRDVLRSISDRQWCRKNFYGLSPHDTLIYGWEGFAMQVKHHTRYVFFKYNPTVNPWDDPEEILPSKMLDELSNIIRKAGLIKTFKKGMAIKRVRIHLPEESYATATELGPPPENKARYSNRMSPAGIPMFYGALNEETAILETIQKGEENKSVGTVATFKTLKPFKVVDLCHLPELPSLFDREQRELRATIRFLKSFVEDISKPIDKDGREHIKYVPTQIFTEYFRHLFRDKDGDEIKGILYPSSRNTDGVSCVLFILNEDCCSTLSGDTSNKLLVLDRLATKRMKLKQFYKNLV